MYSCAGRLTAHEFADAAPFIKWGTDSLKWDDCYCNKMIPSWKVRTSNEKADMALFEAVWNDHFGCEYRSHCDQFVLYPE